MIVKWAGAFDWVSRGLAIDIDELPGDFLVAKLLSFAFEFVH